MVEIYWKYESEFFHILLQNKVWVKATSEESFMYGNHVYRSSLSRISENTPKYAGAIVFSSNDIPLVGPSRCKGSICLYS